MDLDFLDDQDKPLTTKPRTRSWSDSDAKPRLTTYKYRHKPRQDSTTVSKTAFLKSSRKPKQWTEKSIGPDGETLFKTKSLKHIDTTPSQTMWHNNLKTDLMKSLREQKPKVYTGRDAEKRQQKLKHSPTRICLYIIGDHPADNSSLIRSFLHEEYLKEKWGFRSNFYDVHVTVDNLPYIFDIQTAPVRQSMDDALDYERRKMKSYEDIDCFILCFPIWSQESFNRFQTDWIPEIKELSPLDTPFVICGTKSHLRNLSYGDPNKPSKPMEVVDYDFCEKLADTFGASAYMECSANSGDSGANGVNAVFIAAVKAAEQSFASQRLCARYDSCCIT